MKNFAQVTVSSSLLKEELKRAQSAPDSKLHKSTAMPQMSYEGNSRYAQCAAPQFIEIEN